MTDLAHKVPVQVFGADDDARTCDGIYDVLDDAILQVVADGLINRAIYDACYQPVCFRTPDELIAPVAGPDAPLSRAVAIRRAESCEVAPPFVDPYRAGRSVDVHARAYVAFFRAFTEAPLAIALSAARAQTRLLAEVFARAEAMVRTDPGRYPFRHVGVAALLQRLEDRDRQTAGLSASG